MNLPKYVKPLPKFLEFWGGKGYYSALFNKIYFPQGTYDDLLKVKPDPINISLLIHEEEHKKNMNLGLKYVLSRKSRLNEELNAYSVQFTYLKKNKQDYDLDRVAKKLSGPMYLFATDYKNAIKLLEETWRDA